MSKKSETKKTPSYGAESIKVLKSRNQRSDKFHIYLLNKVSIN